MKVRMMILVDGQYRWVDSKFKSSLEAAQEVSIPYIAGASRGEEGCIEVTGNKVTFVGYPVNVLISEDENPITMVMSVREQNMVKESYPCTPEEVNEMRAANKE